MQVSKKVTKSGAVTLPRGVRQETGICSCEIKK